MPHQLPPGVTRGPDGKFQSSGDRMDWSDIYVTSGTAEFHIPAADLSGGTTEHDDIQSESVQLLDLSQHLSSDEVYVIHAIKYDALLAMFTTASAESYGQSGWSIGTEADIGQAYQQDSQFWNGSTDLEQGVVDVAWSDDGDNTEHLVGGFLAAEPSFSDTTNNVAGGSDIDRDRRMIPFSALFGTGPVLDQDDELLCNNGMETDNISDHSITTRVAAMFYGTVHRVS